MSGHEAYTISGKLRVAAMSILATMGFASMAAALAGTNSIPQTNLKSDENVLLFPTIASFDKNRQHWKLDIHGWVFEPERNSLWRNGLINSLASYLELDENSDDKQRFDDRTAMFLVDNERNKSIVVNIEQLYFVSPKTGANGHFQFQARLPAKQEDCPDWLTLRVMTNSNDQRKFTGQVQCLMDEGVSVISDIDDTIKDSQVLDKKLLLEKTFLKDFKSINGMSELYQHWRLNGYQFHYVSSSPWQLYPVLDKFIKNHGFPIGSMHLKLVRLKDKSIKSLFESPEDGKIPTITAILKQFPKRKFILVGDSGEKDPDIYAQIARQNPERILRIYIRDVRKNRASVEKKFNGLSQDKWIVFQDTSEILGKHVLFNKD